MSDLRQQIAELERLAQAAVDEAASIPPWSELLKRQHQCPECLGRGGWCRHGKGVSHMVSCGSWQPCPVCSTFPTPAADTYYAAVARPAAILTLLAGLQGAITRPPELVALMQLAREVWAWDDGDLPGQIPELVEAVAALMPQEFKR